MKICDICKQKADSLTGVKKEIIPDEEINEVCSYCLGLIEKRIIDGYKELDLAKLKIIWAKEVIDRIRDND